MVVSEGEAYYVEHVTRDVEGTRRLLEAVHGWRFGDPEPALGGARVAKLPSGARCGIRAPLRDDEAPVTRSYVRVASAKRAATRAAKAGATVALPPMKLGAHGTIAIFIVGGVDHGVWELPRAKPRKRAAARTPTPKGKKKR